MVRLLQIECGLFATCSSLYIVFSIDYTDKPVIEPLLGRLVNHVDCKVNWKLKVFLGTNIEINFVPLHSALRDLIAGEALLFDYITCHENYIQSTISPLKV